MRHPEGRAAGDLAAGATLRSDFTPGTKPGRKIPAAGWLDAASGFMAQLCRGKSSTYFSKRSPISRRKTVRWRGARQEQQCAMETFSIQTRSDCVRMVSREVGEREAREAALRQALPAPSPSCGEHSRFESVNLPHGSSLYNRDVDVWRVGARVSLAVSGPGLPRPSETTLLATPTAYIMQLSICRERESAHRHTSSAARYASERKEKRVRDEHTKRKRVMRCVCRARDPRASTLWPRRAGIRMQRKGPRLSPRTSFPSSSSPRIQFRSRAC